VTLPIKRKSRTMGQYIMAAYVITDISSEHRSKSGLDGRPNVDVMMNA
jgi:hypothetical protein